jgi:hypothetical protein
MGTENVRFSAIRTVQKPATVKFRTKSGETVSCKALKTVRKRETIRFRSKKR